jgi:SAM-dependent methyltransferase
VLVTWQLLTDDPDERRLFPDLATTLRLPSTPAGPKNRLRHVTRITTERGAFYLKTFLATQWKNRLWFLCSKPRAQNDAERECRVTMALRDAGIDAPRPIALGRAGRSSYYLCAALPGVPCRDVPDAGTAGAALRRRVAVFCGDLLRRGFRFPDLSADHVFVAQNGATPQFAVLDLHNGSLGRPGPVNHRLAMRVLRRFSNSASDLPVSWRQALGFASRLLCAAGRSGRDARAVLAAMPAFSTASRYEVPGKSVAYAKRNPTRAARELRLLQRIWPGRPGETVLDLPCGAGRLLELLTTLGHPVVQADAALAMLRQALSPYARAPMARVQADALQMPFCDRAFDGVVMLRFLHHLTPEASRRAIAEACRTARRFVVVSFFHPCSFHHAQRWLRQLTGAPRTRYAVRLQRVAAWFAQHGFALHQSAAELPFARDLWVAAFVRREHAGMNAR